MTRYQDETIGATTYPTGVYLLEKADPVLGDTVASGGVSNQPLQDLANRTKWLKDHLAAMQGVLTWTEVTLTAASGTFAPAGVSEILILEACAAGGGGAGCWRNAAGSIYLPGGGGGEGANVQNLRIAVTPEVGIAYTLPAGGAAGAFVNSDTYSSTVLGTAGGDLVFGALLTLQGGLGGGIAGTGTMASAPTVHMEGALGGSTTINGVVHRGAPGRNGGVSYPGGDGGGRRGGKGGYLSAPTAGSFGGGGGGGVREAGAAGGDAFMRIGYWAITFTGNT